MFLRGFGKVFMSLIKIKLCTQYAPILYRDYRHTETKALGNIRYPQMEKDNFISKWNNFSYQIQVVSEIKIVSVVFFLFSAKSHVQVHTYGKQGLS